MYTGGRGQTVHSCSKTQYKQNEPKPKKKKNIQIEHVQIKCSESVWPFAEATSLVSLVFVTVGAVGTWVWARERTAIA